MPPIPRLFLKLMLLCLMLCSVIACGGGSTVNGSSNTDNELTVLVDDSPQAAPPPAQPEPVAIDTAATSNEPPVPAESPSESNSNSESLSEFPGLVESGALEPVILEPLPVIDENRQQAAVDPKEYTVADITDLILVTGQSNALGADTAYDPLADSSHERVFAFTENGWARADLHQVWDLGWFPRGNPGSDPSNNFIFHAAKEMVRRRSDRVIGFVLATAPGEAVIFFFVFV